MISIFIPFRDRGRDPLRRANLERVLHHWVGWDVHVVTDGRTGDAQFNRHKAYNQAPALSDAEILVYAESDMLIDFDQIHHSADLAAERTGLVVPFTERHELGPEDSAKVRAYEADPKDCKADIIKPKPRRIGAINVISRQTLELIGRWDDEFEGCWWDDRSMHIAFDMCAGPTRWIDGPSYHLYHLPGYQGRHLTAADKAATARNKRRWQLYKQARTPERIRELTAGKG